MSIAGALLYRTFSASVMYATIAGLMQYAIFTTLVGLLVGKVDSALEDEEGSQKGEGGGEEKKDND